MTLCGYCGMVHSDQGMCPRVQAIEYFPNGTVKHVVFHALVDSSARPSDCCQYPDCPEECRGRATIFPAAQLEDHWLK